MTLQRLHAGHQGIQRCRLRAARFVWWPNISKQIDQMIHHYHICAKDAHHYKEPLMPTSLPMHPWEVIGSDSFELKGTNYLLLIDCFSSYLEVVKMSSTTSHAVIAAIKSIFFRHGLPETLCSDNGPQFSSQEMAEFSSSHGIQHVTSSPYFPQSNDMAERFVQTAKQLLKQSSDLDIALLHYRATPLP